MLNDYSLPDGWVPCGAVNDAEDGYLVEELDSALLSRFVRVKLEPDRKDWCAWALANGVHPKVISFVEGNPKIFEDPQSNPRAWTYVSRLLKAADAGTFTPDDLIVAVAGVVGEVLAGAFADSLGGDKPLTAIRSPRLPGPRSHRAPVEKGGAARPAGGHLGQLEEPPPAPGDVDAVIAEPAQKKNVKDFLRNLVPDLAEQARNWFAERGFTGIAFPKKRAA